MTLEEVKLYLRVDGTDSDTDIAAFMLGASAYIDGKTGKTQVKTGVVDDLPVYRPITADELYNLCNKMLIAHWYEHRGPEVAGTLTKVTHSVDALVNHIAMCGDYI